MNTTQPVITLRGVAKQYRARHILADIDLTVHRGQVVGLIGPNGCGKTTILRIVAGLVRASEGEVWVGGYPLHENPGGMPPSMGVLFDPPGLLPHLTGLQNLRMLASLRHIIDDVAVRQWMTRVGLDPTNRTRVGAYSQGMLQRLGIAQALMEAPHILILDEPTNALDPDSVALMATLIREQQVRGAAILVASHHLEEVARVCTDVFKMVDGRLTAAAQTDLQRYQTEDPEPTPR